MATTIGLKADIDVRVHFTVNEAEARALVDLAGYGVTAFIEAFYAVLGKAYMEKHETGLRSFLEAINTEIPPILYRVDAGRKAFRGEN